MYTVEVQIKCKRNLVNPSDCKEIKPVNPKGNQHWIFIGRTNTETTILWRPDGKLTHWKRPWWWERLRARGEGVAENEIVEWHHQLNGHEFENTLGYSRKQRSLACCSSWGCKELDTTERLNNRLHLVFFFLSSHPPSLSSLFLFRFSLSFLLALLHIFLKNMFFIYTKIKGQYLPSHCFK